MKRVQLALVAMLMLAACTTAVDSNEPGEPSTTVATTETTPTTEPAPEPTTSTVAPETTTTTVDPAEDFFESMGSAPHVTAATTGGSRTWERQDGVWVAGPVTPFDGGPFDTVPLVVSTPSGSVYGVGGQVVFGGKAVASGALADV
ncbi:MAG: hypothetical protein OEW30_19595, partial [Acidimicrobiia bacterium]|nr:hypothetical protein [Acidimicrobiia bacterium]